MRVELTCQSQRKFPEKRFPEFARDGSGHYIADMDIRSAKRARRKARRCHLKCRVYEEKYGRSTNYREKFIQAYPPEHGYYHCSYCGRMLREEDMTVDHIIPVGAAKKSRRAQKYLRGYKGVNDIRNLTASCMKCNLKKGSSYSLFWRTRAKIGRHKWYWAVRYGLILMCAVAAIYYFSKIPPGSLENVPEEIGTRLREWVMEIASHLPIK